MKRFVLCAALTAGALLAAAEPARKSGPHAELLWSGSWETEKNLTNRSQIRLDIPAARLGFRLQMTDRRPAASPELFAASFSGGEDALTALSGAVYHSATNSRLLYGMIKTEGLAARVKNPSLRGAPFTENHAPAQSDLRTDVSRTARPALYLYGGSPDWKPAGGSLTLHGFASASLESTGESGTTLAFSGGKPAFHAGIEAAFAKNGTARLEGFYTGGSVPQRGQSAWFSYEPALPERNFTFSAASLAFSVPAFGFAADGAWSQTFAWGRDFYGNAAFRFGDRPWRFSLAVDGAGSRYVGPDGGENSAEGRFAAKAERRGKHGSLLRFDMLCRAAETPETPEGGFFTLAENPNRASFGVYYRFPKNHAPLALKHSSFKVSGDGRDIKKDSAAADFTAGFNLRQLDFETKVKLSAERDKEEDEPYRFDSLRIRENLVWNGGFLQCGAGLGCTAYDEKEPVWDMSLSAAIKITRGKAGGWFKAKLDSPAVPDDWHLSFSWLAKW